MSVLNVPKKCLTNELLATLTCALVPAPACPMACLGVSPDAHLWPTLIFAEATHRPKATVVTVDPNSIHSQHNTTQKVTPNTRHSHLAHITLASFSCSRRATRTAFTDTVQSHHSRTYHSMQAGRSWGRSVAVRAARRLLWNSNIYRCGSRRPYFASRRRTHRIAAR